MVDRVTIFALLVGASVVTRSPYRQAIIRGPFFLALPLGAPQLLPVPVDNPLTREKVELGQRLFFEKGLSGDGTLACASCHSPDKAFSDGQRLPTGIGGRKGRRNAPTLINRAYGRFMFLDGRASSLEEQALLPMVSPSELGNTYEQIVKKLHLLHDTSALSEAARRGLTLFRGKANCILCHSGPSFTDEKFHNTGVSWKVGPIDYGRYEVTQKEEDRGRFKTPTLRDLRYTAPHLHNGIFDTLEELFGFYDNGGIPNPRDWAINQSS